MLEGEFDQIRNNIKDLEKEMGSFSGVELERVKEKLEELEECKYRNDHEYGSCYKELGKDGKNG